MTNILLSLIAGPVLINVVNIDMQERGNDASFVKYAGIFLGLGVIIGAVFFLIAWGLRPFVSSVFK